MSTENVRAVLFRTLIDSDFHNLMLTNPDEALKGYDLTNDERRILITPDKDLYKIIEGAGADWTIGTNWGLFQAIPVTPSPALKEDDQKVAQLVNSIQNAVGQERFSSIMQLVQRMQEPKQIRSDPPQNE